MITQAPNPGALIRVRSSNWKVQSFNRRADGSIVICRATDGIAKGKTAHFLLELEKDYEVIDPAIVKLVPDKSPGYIDTKLFLEAAFRHTPTATREPQTLGKAAIDDLSFQHAPVRAALNQDRVRLLIADDVGLGKTLEAGLITSELILRGRANRILVVTTRSMLTQFQKEFWTRFAIPLSRLDSSAIRRMRNQIPAHYNVFDQFDRAIVSIDTLKRDSHIRGALEESNWDLVIIDEAHNAARRAKAKGDQSLRARLAKLLSRRADSLLLLTATPHDGSQESFASLIEMLDPTRVPNVMELRREDIEDLVVRRFRFSPEVIAAIGKIVPKRQLNPRHFPLNPAEEQVYRTIAELQLDVDQETGRKRVMDLFRTTLAKAIFSSPAACLESVERRIQGIKAKRAQGTDQDRTKLEELAAMLRKIGPEDFSKYQNLLAMLREMKWTGHAKRDRLVIFSERIRTVAWLEEHLKADLGLSDEAIGRIDGGSVEADEMTQSVLEDFGQENKPIRILIASDMASEGLNLHFQSHRLIHFDLPWSLLRFQQRNGRIDRYGQDRPPQIYYFVGESEHPKVRDMWVLEKLVEKDEAAQRGVGDPAVFLGKGDAELEEEVIANAVAHGIGAEEFAREMEARVADAHERASLDDAYDMLFGDYSGQPDAPFDDLSQGVPPPRLFADTFTYASEMLHRLEARYDGLIAGKPGVDVAERLIHFALPDDMKSDGGLGYTRREDVDEKYMPVEAVQGGQIRLTDDRDVVDTAIGRARTDEKAWPSTQFLWDGHPILSWFSDRSDIFFPDRAVPFCSLEGRLARAETCILIHGAVPNEVGAPIVDVWGVVVVLDGRVDRIESMPDFIARSGLRGQTPNTGIDRDLNVFQDAVTLSVNAFQSHLVNIRKQREVEIEMGLDETLGRLSALQGRFMNQIELDLGIAVDQAASNSGTQKRRVQRKENRTRDVNEIFDDWASWFQRNRTMVKDPNPYVEVKAVFAG